MKKLAKMDNINNDLQKKNIRNNNYKEEGFFDGIRKDNSRFIFTILLAIIIIDFIYDCIL